MSKRWQVHEYFFQFLLDNLLDTSTFEQKIVKFLGIEKMVGNYDFYKILDNFYNFIRRFGLIFRVLDNKNPLYYRGLSWWIFGDSNPGPTD